MTPANNPNARPSQLLRPSLPVAVIVPILNEANTLAATLESIVAQEYPPELIEILIVDGGSTDCWRDALGSVDLGKISVRTLLNPHRVTPAAVNLALRSTNAPAVLWISGHCRLAPDYLTQCASSFMEYESVATGGALLVEGKGLAGRLNALVLRSPIGTGMAPWRSQRGEGWVSAVNFALFDRQTLLDIGGLDERLARNQDNDLIRRLHAHGVRFRMVDTTVTYIAPSTLRGLWSRAWANGQWNVWCWRLGVPAVKWYHLTPMVALFVAVALLVLSFFSPVAVATMAALSIVYVALILVHTVTVTVLSGFLWAIPMLPVHTIIFHALYGLGSWVALLRPVPGRVGSGVESG